MAGMSSPGPRSTAAVLVLCSMLLVACGRPQVLHVDDVAPRSERSPESVRLLLDPPLEPYLTIAVIRSSRQTPFRSMESLKAEVRAAAARLGADAVILGLSSAESSGGTGVAADGSVVFVSGSDELRVVGRAIVFTGAVPARTGGASNPR
jgi:hypothetical protein